jgi:hypothetical protein
VEDAVYTGWAYPIKILIWQLSVFAYMMYELFNCYVLSTSVIVIVSPNIISLQLQCAVYIHVHIFQYIFLKAYPLKTTTDLEISFRRPRHKILFSRVQGKAPDGRVMALECMAQLALTNVEYAWCSN